MMLTELTPIPLAAVPVAAFQAHLRLGRGFGTDSLQDPLLEGFLRAAFAAIESRTGKVLITREFQLELTRWRDPSAEILPLAPVTAISALTQVAADGSETVITGDQYRLVRDAQTPRLCPHSACLPAVPTGGYVRITLTAGTAATHAELPADLAQAVLMLAAHYYEHREDTGLHGGCMPFGVTSLIERYRSVRLRIGTPS